MSFLAPWFWLGAAAVAAPIIFHLVRQRIRKRQQFSSLMFLKPTPPKIKRRTKLEHLLLLALRCLILLLLAAAFARPFFKRPPTVADNQQNGETVAVLLDTSASMKRGELWATAVRTVGDLANELRPARQVTLLSYDRQVRTLVSFDDWSRADASQRAVLWKERLAGSQTTSAGTHLGKALVSAAELIEDARSREKAATETSPARIIVVSDMQAGSHLEGLAGFNWPARVSVELRSPTPLKTSNAGLHPVAQNENATLTFSTTNEVRVFVSNAHDSSKELFQLAWRHEDGRAIAGSDQVYLPAGQSRVVRVAAPTNSPDADRVILTGDDEPFDNEVFIPPQQPDHVNILELGGDDASKPGSLSFFLRRAFQSTAQQEITFLAMTNAAQLATTSTNIDFFVAMNGANVGGAVKRELDAGHSGLLVLGQEASATALQEIANVPALAASEGQSRSYALLGRIEFSHPLFAPFLDMRFSDFSGIHFWKYRKIDPTVIPDAKVLAAFDSGDPALLELKRGGGTLFVLTSSWRQSDSQLALSSKFVPLLYSMLELNRPPRPAAESRLVGDDYSLADFTRPAELKLPSGEKQSLPADQSEYTFENPGIYQIESTSGKKVSIAVNLDPAESRTAPLNEEELVRIGVPLHTNPLTISRTMAARLQQQKDSETENQQKNWRWLLAAAAGIFLLESWLAGRGGQSDSATVAAN